MSKPSRKKRKKQRELKKLREMSGEPQQPTEKTYTIELIDCQRELNNIDALENAILAFKKLIKADK